MKLELSLLALGILGVFVSGVVNAGERSGQNRSKLNCQLQALDANGEKNLTVQAFLGGRDVNGVMLTAAGHRLASIMFPISFRSGLSKRTSSAGLNLRHVRNSDVTQHHYQKWGTTSSSTPASA